MACATQAEFPSSRSLRRIRGETAKGLGPPVSVVGVDSDGGVADRLVQRAASRANGWYASSHCLERWETEAFGMRGHGEELRPTVETVELVVRDVAEDIDSRLGPERRHDVV
jgi:hypothetical protein